MDRHLALAALDMALKQCRPTAGLVHHSDRGSTYASGDYDYRKALDAREIECSMSRKGDCWDNAVTESFFASMKREMEDVENFESWAHATLSIGEYIDGFYNSRRRNSTIGYKSPVEFDPFREEGSATKASTGSGQPHNALRLLRAHLQWRDS